MLETMKRTRSIVIRHIMRSCADGAISVDEALESIGGFNEEFRNTSDAILHYQEACMKYIDSASLKEVMDT